MRARDCVKAPADVMSDMRAGRSAPEVGALLPLVLIAAHDLKAHGAIVADRAASLSGSPRAAWRPTTP